MDRAAMDAKTRLNQWAQAHDLGAPAYEILETTGPDHDPTFRVAVSLGEISAESNEVKSKQAGEQISICVISDYSEAKHLGSQRSQICRHCPCSAIADLPIHNF